MKPVFGEVYASVYDKLYVSKDYSGECDMVEALLAEQGKDVNLRVLDLGCGTGGHAIELARRGHFVTGVDLAEPMLAQAREKAKRCGLSGSTEFLQGDIREIRIPRKDFDAAIMMFAVLGYQRTDDDVASALLSAREHLSVGGIFVFDLWYGPGVLQERPGNRERVVDEGDRRIVRRSRALLDEQRHLCTVTFDVEVLRNGRPESSVQEEHIMRYFFPEELRRLATDCGMTLQTLRDFSVWRQTVGTSSWNAVGVMRAV